MIRPAPSMTTPASRPTPPGQQWPCGPDCIFSHPLPGNDGEWIWCERPGADVRLRRVGRDCTNFQSSDSRPETPPDPAGFFPSPPSDLPP
jgi:hypothetical protein